MDALPTALLIERPLIYASLYDLAAVIFGSEGIARQSSGGSKDEFDKLRIRHEVNQAAKLIIEVAVVMRNLMDGERWPVDVIHESRVGRRPERTVGTLWVADGTESALSFRDACNKLVHAKKVSFGMRDLPSKTPYLDGSAELRGELKRQEWIAKVSVSDFIRMAVRQL